MLKDAFNRLIKASLIGEVRSDRKTYADFESIKTFETNLRELLLSPPGDETDAGNRSRDWLQGCCPRSDR